jgi:Glycosyl hydrolase family 9./N-terminal ig-like domain of cellulase.
MRSSFEKQLIESGYIHHLLKPDTEKTVEARLLKKDVTKNRFLWDGKDLSRWSKRGLGSISQEDGALTLCGPFRIEFAEQMEHYTGFGDIIAALAFDGENWQEYNRITCKMRPRCDGYHAPYVMLNLCNDGEIKIPDMYNREGHHIVNLNNHEWNKCVWEFPDLPRDKITEFSISIYLAGNERGGADDYIIDVCDIRLERVEESDVSLGWQGNADTVSFSTSGYWTDGKKTAIAQVSEGDFEVCLEETGETVYKGKLMPMQNEKGNFGLMDFTELQGEGRYFLKVNGCNTERFAIGKHVMDEAAWKVLNYIYSERCGYPVGGGHSSCHGDIVATHNGLSMTYNGGWHDAGDLSQQTLQTGEVAEALFELAEKVKDDTLLYRRLVEEACWGLDFVMRCRFGDGVRAFSAGLSRWTNGLIGDYDDEQVRCHNRSFDNFLLSGVEAYGAAALMEDNPDLARACRRAAIEDYGFARARFDEVGMENCVLMEHTYNASLSQYYAVMCRAAALIYRLNGEPYYEEEAVRYTALMLECQDNDDAGLPFQGFFYRDAEKKHIVHFNHQSREHIFMQALEAVCSTFPEHCDLQKWEEAMGNYGSYVKAMHGYAAPYGMLPAGVHKYDEPEDHETFELLHVWTGYEENKENYVKQLEAGIPLNKEYCIRQFPVWFSFRGNEAVHLSAGKAAAICGGYLKDNELLEIARDQIYFTSGKNPFGQSLIYGEGSNYAQQYAAHCGETVGEIPVGIQTRMNEDVPYWPMANNATYKEIWMSSAGHWIRLLATLY